MYKINLYFALKVLKAVRLRYKRRTNLPGLEKGLESYFESVALELSIYEEVAWRPTEWDH